MKLGRAACGLLVTALVSACVLADPAPTLPIVAEGPLAIEATAPSNELPLATWPADDEFDIPVYLVDPSKAIQWVAYVDYTPTTVGTNPTGAQPVEGPKTVDPTDGAAVRLVRAIIQEPLGAGCHTVEVVIAYAFTGFTPVTPPGGAVVTWLYTSSGNPGDCTPYEAGTLVDGTFPSDASKDATVGDGAN